MGRKHCRKRRKCWLPAFSPFPTMFSKAAFHRGPTQVAQWRACPAHDHVVVSLIPGELSFRDISPLTSAEACQKSSWWLCKENCVSTGVSDPGNTCESPTAMI